MSIREFIERHPYLTSWVVLAIGMVAILLWTSKDVELLPSQRAWLVVATILLAGACVWIISWEEGEEEEKGEE
jgi:predicted tellurium resistance membrane protein TerC